MQCPRCSASNNPASKFCAACGAPLPASGQSGTGATAQGQGAAPPTPGGLALPGDWGGPPPPPPGGFPAPSPFGGPAAAPFNTPNSPYGPPPAYAPPPPMPGMGNPMPPPPMPGPPPMGLGGPGADQPWAPPGVGPFPPAPAWGQPNAAPQGQVSNANPYAPTMTPDGAPAPVQQMPPAPFAPPGLAPPGLATPGLGGPPVLPPQGPGMPPAWGPELMRAPEEASYPRNTGAGAPMPDRGSLPSAPPLPLPTPPVPGPSAGADPEQVPDGAPRVLAGFLVSYESTELGTFWPIYQGRNSLGRKDAAIGLDIEIDNATTSSRHAVLLASARPGRVKVEDQGSTNGTFVNEVKLIPSSRHELKDGQKIRFGGFTAILKLV